MLNLFNVCNESERWLLIFNYEGDNAAIYNPDGSEYCKFYAGEGIQDCQVDVNEDIWVSYCDEGFSEVPNWSKWYSCF